MERIVDFKLKRPKKGSYPVFGIYSGDHFHIDQLIKFLILAKYDGYEWLVSSQKTKKLEPFKKYEIKLKKDM